MRKNISSGAKWEAIASYSRAVRVGNIIEIAGTTASNENGIVGNDDAAAQTRYIFEKISKALEEAGATLNDVVRTRMFVTDILQWEAIVQVHGEIFKNIMPVSTMVEVKALIEPEMLIEIEATAIVED